MSNTQEAQRIQGIAASPGLGIGPAVVLRKEQIEVVRKAIPEGVIEAETVRLKKAIDETISQIQALRNSTALNVGEEEAQIFDAHESFLVDPSYVGVMIDRIRNDRLNAEYVCEQVTEETRQMLSALPDDYLQARADDIRDVGYRLLKNLSGVEMGGETDIPENAVMIAEELAPSDLAHLTKSIAGLVTARGSKTGHVAIMARTLGIPAVLGVQQQIDEIPAGKVLVVDGDAGTILVDPDEATLRQMQDKASQQQRLRLEALELASENAKTVDGEPISVFANIGSLKDVEEALKNGAEGVGLFRTEFLYIENHEWPTEDEQFTAYKHVLQQFEGRPVVIRTLDIGGDKELPYAELPREENPFLGHRAIRFCLSNPDIFKTQLRALLRASAYGVLWIMIPMVSTLTEVRQAKQLLQECRHELEVEGVTMANHIPVGIMVETPAAAVMADILAPEVDFMSIGTNDLTQYTLAADRGNEQVAHLYQSHDPAVLRLIEFTAKACKKAGIPVGVCGELAGDESFTELLIGLGIQELSMSSRSIPRVKLSVRRVRKDSAEQFSYSLLAEPDAESVASRGRKL